MSYLGPFSQAFPAAAASGAAIYSQYYTGETFYVWPVFPTQNTEPSPVRSEYPSPSPSCSPESPVLASATEGSPRHNLVLPHRSVKRRVTANRKERRRTLSINYAFSQLRNCIPQVPPDTKLSKIKTLQLATSYIAYLMDVLAQDPGPAFKTDPDEEEEDNDPRQKKVQQSDFTSLVNSCTSDKKSRCRTGWPQHVWALELKHKNPS